MILKEYKNNFVSLIHEINEYGDDLFTIQVADNNDLVITKHELLCLRDFMELIK